MNGILPVILDWPAAPPWAHTAGGLGTPSAAGRHGRQPLRLGDPANPLRLAGGLTFPYFLPFTYLATRRHDSLNPTANEVLCLTAQQKSLQILPVLLVLSHMTISLNLAHLAAKCQGKTLITARANPDNRRRNRPAGGIGLETIVYNLLFKVSRRPPADHRYNSFQIMDLPDTPPKMSAMCHYSYRLAR